MEIDVRDRDSILLDVLEIDYYYLHYPFVFFDCWVLNIFISSSCFDKKIHYLFQSILEKNIAEIKWTRVFCYFANY